MQRQAGSVDVTSLNVSSGLAQAPKLSARERARLETNSAMAAIDANSMDVDDIIMRS